MSEAIRIERLRSDHDRTGFSCGVSPLDRYFREQVGQDVRRRVSNCFIAVAASEVIAGYYSFAASGVPVTELPAEQLRRLPRYQLVPAALIGRLAVDRRFQGQGIGGLLIIDAVGRAMRAEPAIYALVVDAKDDATVRFYRHHGFRPLLSRPMSPFVPIAEAARRLASA